MKKLLLILSFTLGLATAANAETWSCSYLFNGKAENYIFVREGDRFKEVTSGGHFDIVYEDGSMISLHLVFNTVAPIYFAALLDKTKNMFASVGLQVENRSTALIEGKCEVY